MPLVHLKMLDDDGVLVEGVVWLLEDQDDLVDEQKNMICGKVGDLYHGDDVVVETDDGIFAISPKDIISVKPY